MKRLACIVLLIIISLSYVNGSAQNPPNVVAFINDNSIGAASIIDEGADGISRLAQMVRGLGFPIRMIDLSAPIGEDARLVIMARPRTSLTASQVARLWLFLERGGHLLLAADPRGVAGLRDDATASLRSLLLNQYGITTNEDVLTENFFRFQELQLTQIRQRVYPDNTITDPILTQIIQPLIRYELPIEIWAGRSVFVDSFGMDTRSVPLLYTETAYGERSDIRTSVYNINTDTRGHLLTAGIGINTATGSRIALLGDSELLQNIYGFTRILGTDTPRYVGNYIFMQRLLAWLLDVPAEDYPNLPRGVTWLALDGVLDDWANLPTSTDVAVDVFSPQYDLLTAQSFYNDNFVYVGLATLDAPLATSLLVELTLSDGNVIQITPTQAIFSDTTKTELLPDSAIRLGSGIELRLPRRVFSDIPTLTQVCISDAQNAQKDCLALTTPVVRTTDYDPVSVRFPPAAPMGRVSGDGAANLRIEPNINAPVRAFVENNTQFAVISRTPDNQWVQVVNGRYTGWLASLVFEMNITFDQLPISAEFATVGITPTPTPLPATPIPPTPVPVQPSDAG